MKFEIKNRFTGKVQVVMEIEDHGAVSLNLGIAVKAALRDGADLTGADLAGANLTGAYLADAYLADAYLAGANLADANLTDAYLAGAYLAGAYLARADLTNADLPRAYMIDADLTGTKNTNIIWQPIETAPLDGTRIILWLGNPWNEFRAASWYKPWSCWVEEEPECQEAERYGIGSELPSHWMIPGKP